MRLLLDTQVALWFLAGDPRLDARARRSIESAENTCLLSDASLWEISIKQSIGKLKLAEPFAPRLISALRRNAIASLALEKSHLFGVAELPFHHRDPIDRLLISAARAEGLSVVTNDPSFRLYDVDVIT